MSHFTLSQTVADYPQHPYQKMKNDILGSDYTLSLVFIGDQRARTLNIEQRGKEYIPNVLSFPLDDKTGEIYIAPSVAAREAKKFDMSPDGYVGYLFIHGLLHLKGLEHGDTMDKAEQRYLKKYRLV